MSDFYCRHSLNAMTAQAAFGLLEVKIRVTLQAEVASCITLIVQILTFFRYKCSKKHWKNAFSGFIRVFGNTAFDSEMPCIPITMMG